MSGRSFETVVFVLASALVAGCFGDLDPVEGAGGGGESAGGTGGSGGSGAAGPGGSGGGGDAGQGGDGGDGGEAGSGGGTGGCLDVSTHDAIFTIDVAELCVVERHTAPFEIGYALVPKWGRHGGPVTIVQSFNPADDVTITRWSVSGAVALGVAQTVGPFSLAIPAQSVGPFLTPAVVDLPLSGWSIVGWTGASSVGEIIATAGAGVAERWPNVGYFDGVAVQDGTDARLLHTGLTELEDGDDTNGESGVYAADFCPGPMLCSNNPTETIATWGLANGPVAIDKQDNAFAVNTDYIAGTQEIRGFRADDVAPHANGATGTTLATLDGYGSALAVIDFTALPLRNGIVLFQPFEGFDAQPVIAQYFSVSSGDIVKEGDPVAAITLTNQDAVSLMNDDTGRVWLGVVTGTSETTFYVLDRH